MRKTYVLLSIIDYLNFVSVPSFDILSLVIASNFKTGINLPVILNFVVGDQALDYQWFSTKGDFMRHLSHQWTLDNVLKTFFGCHDCGGRVMGDGKLNTL